MERKRLLGYVSGTGGFLRLLPESEGSRLKLTRVPWIDEPVDLSMLEEAVSIEAYEGAAENNFAALLGAEDE